MKIEVGSKVLVEGTVVKVDDSDAPFKIDFDGGYSIWSDELQLHSPSFTLEAVKALVNRFNYGDFISRPSPQEASEVELLTKRVAKLEEREDKMLTLISDYGQMICKLAEAK